MQKKYRQIKAQIESQPSMLEITQTVQNEIQQCFEDFQECQKEFKQKMAQNEKQYGQALKNIIQGLSDEILDIANECINLTDERDQKWNHIVNQIDCLKAIKQQIKQMKKYRN